MYWRRYDVMLETASEHSAGKYE